MTNKEVARLLRGLKSNPPIGRDQEEVAGYADLLGIIFDNYKSLRLTESFVLMFHKILLNFSKKDEYYLALRVAQKNHKTKKEDITFFANFMLDVMMIRIKSFRDK